MRFVLDKFYYFDTLVSKKKNPHTYKEITMQKNMLCVLLISCFALHASDIAQSSDEWDPKKPITALSSGGDVQVTAEDHAISYLEAIMGQKIQITDGSDEMLNCFFMIGHIHLFVMHIHWSNWCH